MFLKFIFSDIGECSFNIIPRKEKPTFKYSSVTRGREKRSKLEGRACPQCEDYYRWLSCEIIPTFFEAVFLVIYL